MMAKHFCRLLQKGNGGFGMKTQSKGNHSAILVNMSAKVGSITDSGKNARVSFFDDPGRVKGEQRKEAKDSREGGEK